MITIIWKTLKSGELRYALGALFENFVVSEFVKASLNRGKQPDLYFWLDKHKKEIDLLPEREVLTPIEIKSGKTLNASFLDQLAYWNALSGNTPENAFLIYGGETDFQTPRGQVHSWRNMNLLIAGLL